MHECTWAKRGLARIATVHKPARAFADGHRVVRAQFHEEIVRMLAIDQRFALVRLTCLEEQGRAAGWKRKWLSAEHAAQLEGSRTRAPYRRRHEPVCRFKLRHASWPTLAIDARYEVVMKHQQPLAGLLVQHRHRARIRLPRRARTHSTHRHEVRFTLAEANKHLIVVHHKDAVVHVTRHFHLGLFGGRLWARSSGRRRRRFRRRHLMTFVLSENRFTLRDDEDQRNKKNSFHDEIFATDYTDKD